MGRRNHIGSCEVERLGLRISSVRERFRESLDFLFFFDYMSCGRVEQIAAVSRRLFLHDLVNSRGGVRFANYIGLTESRPAVHSFFEC